MNAKAGRILQQFCERTEGGEFLFPNPREITVSSTDPNHKGRIELVTCHKHDASRIGMPDYYIDSANSTIKRTVFKTWSPGRKKQGLHISLVVLETSEVIEYYLDFAVRNDDQYIRTIRKIKYFDGGGMPVRAHQLTAIYFIDGCPNLVFPDLLLRDEPTWRTPSKRRFASRYVEDYITLQQAIEIGEVVTQYHIQSHAEQTLKLAITDPIAIDLDDSVTVTFSGSMRDVLFAAQAFSLMHDLDDPEDEYEDQERVAIATVLAACTTTARKLSGYAVCYDIKCEPAPTLHILDETISREVFQ